MNQIVLKKLMEVNDYPCVSILLPTYRTAPDNQKNAIRIRNLVREAEERLLGEFPKRDITPLIGKMQALANNIDISRTLDGLGLFISKDFAEKVDLPFRVRERVIIDKAFATRDIIKSVNRGTRYYLLAITAQKARLMSCFRDDAVEISDGFPVENDMEFAQFNLSDLSREKKKKLKEFYNNVDKRVLEIIKKDPEKLVLAGVEKNLSLYREVADNKDIILTQLSGNFDNASVHDLGKKAWPKVKEKMQEVRNEALEDLNKAVSNGKYASGLSQVWNFTSQGRTGLLLIEEDYHQPAKLENQNTLTFLHKPQGNGTMDDAVDEVAELAINKGGRVLFVENGSLKEHEKIAAILRY